MKRCSKCQIVQDLVEFRKRVSASDGLDSWCKSCSKEKEKRRRASKEYQDYMKDYLRDYYQKNKEKIEQQKQEYRRRRPEIGREQTRKQRRENPLKYKAHTIVKREVRAGRLVTHPCEICGAPNQTEAHHEDYHKPLRS